ncbi:MAG TPA: nuclear transport factor 2 family protein [Thermoanaerobaculia bacterium]|nr:nuclear transport factor 2 family protein [Thermoanaerobaculia bacterium]
MSARSVVVLAILFASCATRDVAEERVRLGDLHRQRFEAMVVRDFDALNELLTEDVVYVHSDGAVEAKQQFLDRLRSERIKYRAIKAPDPAIRMYGDSAVVTGRGSFSVTVNRNDSDVELLYTAVYRRGGVRGWQLVSWQSTAVP